MVVKYPIRKEFKKYSAIHMPVSPGILKVAKIMMPIIQKGRRLDACLEKLEVELPHCKAVLIKPKRSEKLPLLIYYHGGAFVMKAAAYHKNLAQTYAKEANCAVLFVDYSLAPKHKFPVPVKDCLDAYQWALTQGEYTKILLGGDSAGANLVLAVTQMAKQMGLPMPLAQMLIYPVVDSRMMTDSMQRFTDTPLWNSTQNRKMYALYADEEEFNNPLVSPMEAEDLSILPPTYIEVAEYDCLHDEGVALAKRLTNEGVAVTLNETKATIHGYDIAEKSEYVKEQVRKRIEFITHQIYNQRSRTV